MPKITPHAHATAPAAAATPAAADPTTAPAADPRTPTTRPDTAAAAPTDAATTTQRRPRRKKFPPPTPDAAAAALAEIDPEDAHELRLTPDTVGDLSNIPVQSRARATRFLAAWSRGQKYTVAVAAGPISPIEITYARQRSKTFAGLMDAIHIARMQHAVRRTEETLSDIANGDQPQKHGYYPPDSRAAQILLQAHAPEYRPNATPQAQQIVINLGI